MQTRQKPNFSHRNFTTLSCSRSTARKPPTEPQLIHVTYYLTHGLSKRNIFFLTFFRSSSLPNIYLFMNNSLFSRFLCSFNSSAASLMPKSRDVWKSSHGNIHIAKQHICYTVKLHCLYENRSPDDAIVILMIPCFFLNYFCDFFDW